MPRRPSPVEMKTWMMEWLVQRIFFVLHQGGLTAEECKQAVDAAVALKEEHGA